MMMMMICTWCCLCLRVCVCGYVCQCIFLCVNRAQIKNSIGVRNAGEGRRPRGRRFPSLSSLL